MRRVALLLSLALIAVSAPAHASLAPSVPTFLLKWGSNGSGSGQFNNPIGVAVAANGDVYVADMSNHRIQRFTPNGVLLSTWGSSGTGNGQFNNPGDIAIDPSGRVLVTDYGNRRVQIFDLNGTYLAQFGSLGSGDGQFNGPTGIACDAGGNIFVGDQTTNRIQKFTSAGVFVTSWGGTGSGDGKFSMPTRFAVDADGNVYATDNAYHRVQKFSNDGVFLAKWGTQGAGDGQLYFPYGIHIDRFGAVYVCDQFNHRVQRFTTDGTFVGKWGASGTGDGQFNLPACITSAPNGDLFVSDQMNHRVVRFSRAGEGGWFGAPVAISAWGSPGFGDGEVQTPSGIAIDPYGRVYIADTYNNRIQRFTLDGAYVSKVGTTGTGPDQFDNPLGIAATVSYVYVADFGNHRIHRYNSILTSSTRWGSFGSGNGQFVNPRGVAVDAAGNVYVADSGNDRIQKFDGLGTFITKWGSTGSGNGQFSLPMDVAVDADGFVYVTDRNNNRVQKFTSSGAFVAVILTGALAPSGLAVDAHGDLLMTDDAGFSSALNTLSPSGVLKSRTTQDLAAIGTLSRATDAAVTPNGDVILLTGTARMIRYASPPETRMVYDVPGDQGGAARVRFRRASNDAADATVPVQRYDLYRRIDAYAPALGARPAAPDQALLDGWEFVSSVPAAGDESYAAVVPTLTDASASSLSLSAFLVRAVTATPSLFTSTGTATGYSLDDLAPATPVPFTAAYVAGATHLHWGVNTAPDFAYFTLHRGADAAFAPSLANRIAATADTDHVDVGAAGAWYKLAAVDASGNLSAFALLGPDQTLDVETPVVAPALAFALDTPSPNPVRGRALTVRFALPTAGAARVELLDVAGRRVAERVLGAPAAGRHTVTLGRERALEPGVYVVRLSQGERHATRRVVVVD